MEADVIESDLMEPDLMEPDQIEPDLMDIIPLRRGLISVTTIGYV